MKINVHIKDRMFTIQCGDGAQRVRWLGDVSAFRYDQFFGQVTGIANFVVIPVLITMIGTVRGLRFENGTQLRMDDIINEQLQDDTHIWVILKEDIEAMSDAKGSKSNARPKTTAIKK